MAEGTPPPSLRTRLLRHVMWPLVLTWLQTGLVPRLPTAVLATGMMLAGMLSAACGAVLRTVTLGRREVKRLRYLAIPGVRHVLEAR